MKIRVPDGIRVALALLARRPRVLVGAGVALVFVPTFFTIFVGATEWPALVRCLVLVVWLLTAAFVVVGSVRQGQQVESLLGGVRARRDEQRMLAQTRIIQALLGPASGFPPHYEFRIFIYDKDRDRLIPSYEPNGTQASSEGWRPGCGATGVAWETSEYVQVRGKAVSDGTYGLTEEQQERYKDYQVVAAMPIRGDRAPVVAILTAISKKDDGQLASPDGQRKHHELAIIIGRVLVDLLGDV